MRLKLPTDKDGDVLFCTVKTYKLFLAHGRLGAEALPLYFHLMFTARLQQTNRVKANDKYLMKALQVGKVKLKSLKAFLKILGLIEYTQERGDDGRMKESYIQVNFLSQEKLTDGTESVPPDNNRWYKSCTAGTENRPPVPAPKCLNLTMKEEAAGMDSVPPAEPAGPPDGPPGPPVANPDRVCKVQATPAIKKLMSDLCDQMNKRKAPEVQLKLGPIGEVEDKPNEKAEERNENREGQATG
jgi:hypothetical protein